MNCDAMQCNAIAMLCYAMLSAHRFLNRAQAWAAGHAIVLLTALYALVGLVTFRPHPYAYKLSYLGATGACGCECACSAVLSQLLTD